MHSLSILSLSIGVARAAVLSRRDNVISQSTRDPTYNLAFGKINQLTTVNPGVTYWMSGGSTHNFQGNINNYGTIIASQTDNLKSNPYAGGQTANCVGSDSNNGNLVNNAGALISLNDYGAASAPTYDWHLHTMENRGSLQFCGRGDTGGSTYQLYCDLDCHNYGVIDFEQYNNNNLGASFTWRNSLVGPSALTNIYNYGAFRLVNVVHHNVQNVYGDGCWVLDEGSVLYLEDGTGTFQNFFQGPSFPNQKIYFTNSAQPAGRLQTIHMDTGVYSKNCDFGPQVYGFGSGKAIEFYEIIKSTGGFAYANGILTVTFTSNNKVNIKLGVGYDASKFYVAKNSQNYNKTGYNAIFYNGNAPAQTVPGQCQVSLPKCSNPESTANSSSSTTSVSSTVRSTSTSATTSLPVTTTSSTTTRPLTTSSSSTTRPTTSSTTSLFTSSSSTRITSSSSTLVFSSTTTSSSRTSVISSSSVPATSSTSVPTTSSSTTPVNSTVNIPTTSSSSTPLFSSSSSVPVTSSPGISTTSTTSTSSTGSTVSTTSSSSASALISYSSTALVTTSASTTQSSSTTNVSGTGPCANGAGPDSTYTASNGVVYGICKNTDFSGGDLTNVGSIPSAEACTEACSKSVGCIAGSLVRGAQVCYLKSSRNPATSDSGVDSIYKISSGGTTSNSASAMSSGSLLSTSIITSSTIQQTTTVSSSTSNPITSNAVSTSTSSLTSISTATTSGVAGPCAGGAGPSSTYVATNGDVYGVCLNTDFGGNDITSVGSIASPEACAEVCSNMASCVAGSLVRGGQVCYLKNAKSSPSANSGVDSVYKISSMSSGSATISVLTSSSVSISTSASSAMTSSSLSSSSTTISSIATTTTAGSAGICANGAAPASTYTASNGDVYGVCLHTDFYGGDLTAVNSIPDTSSCAEACSRTPGCIAGSLHLDSQTCYLKSTQNSASANSAVDAIYKISSGLGSSTNTGTASTTSVSITSTTSQGVTTNAVSSTTFTSSASSTSTTASAGPCANGAAVSSTYTSSNGDVYGVCLNTDFSGGDLTAVNSIPDTSSCAEICSQTSGCVAGSLVRGGQTCYLKSTLNPASANSGVDSVYKISSGSDGSNTSSKTSTAVSTSSVPSTTSALTSTTSSVCTCAQTVTITITAMPTV